MAARKQLDRKKICSIHRAIEAQNLRPGVVGIPPQNMLKFSHSWPQAGFSQQHFAISHGILKPYASRERWADHDRSGKVVTDLVHPQGGFLVRQEDLKFSPFVAGDRLNRTDG
jgi:hypothetical protein